MVVIVIVVMIAIVIVVVVVIETVIVIVVMIVIVIVIVIVVVIVVVVVIVIVVVIVVMIVVVIVMIVIMIWDANILVQNYQICWKTNQLLQSQFLGKTYVVIFLWNHVYPNGLPVQIFPPNLQITDNQILSRNPFRATQLTWALVIINKCSVIPVAHVVDKDRSAESEHSLNIGPSHCCVYRAVSGE